VTILPFAEGLSGRPAADTVRSRIDWKYILRLELAEPGFDASVLSEFRTRLIAGAAGPGARGERLVAGLRQYAPSWLAHLPALCPPEALTAVQRQGKSTTRTRMLRELAEALEALAAEQPVVLVLEDLHWSDPSTVEALALLARRRDTARLLVVGTYRPVDLILYDHPLKTVKQELAAHGQCVEIPLGGLSPQAVAAYVAQRRGTPAGHDAVVAFVYQRTEGHPLFMVQVVDNLEQQHLLQDVTQTAVDSSGGLGMDQVVPQGLQELLEAHLGRLSAEAQQVLEVGSVAGAEFVVASVAAGVQRAPEVVEAGCERLARQGQFLEDRGLVEWPDGTVSGRYGFRHALYQEVVYQWLGAGHRARVHRLIGEREAAGYGAQAGARAAVLAMHFAHGQDTRRAVPYLRQAAETALRRHAHREAIDYLTTALALLQAQPEAPERAQHELTVQLLLAPAMSFIRGYASPEVEQAATRARELCQQVGEASQRFRVLWGLRVLYLQRAQVETALDLARQLLSLAQQAHDPALHVAAHQALVTVWFWRGDLPQGHAHVEAGMAAYDTHRDRVHARFYGHDPGVVLLTYGAWIRWLLGYPQQSIQRSQQAQTLVRELARPLSLVLVLSYEASLHQLRREVRLAQERAEAALALAEEHGLPFFAAWGTMVRGWALGALGRRQRASASWPRRWRWPAKRGAGSMRRSCIGSRATCSSRSRTGAADATAPPRPRPSAAGVRPWPLPAASRPRPGSCAPP
jgi:hypothetical protein